MANIMLGNNVGEERLHYTLEKVGMVLNDECTIRVDNKRPRYIDDICNLYISKEADERYTEKEIKCQLSVLQMYVQDSINALHDEDMKSFRKSYRLSRGIINKLGIEQKKLSIHLKYAPTELLETLDAHQEFAELVGDLYDTRILRVGFIPLMKKRTVNGEQGFIKSGAEYAEKLMNHFHRTGLEIAKNPEYNYYEEEVE